MDWAFAFGGSGFEIYGLGLSMSVGFVDIRVYIVPVSFMDHH